MNGYEAVSLQLEVAEIERRGRPGCGNSSSTHPRCTCIPIASDEDVTD